MDGRTWIAGLPDELEKQRDLLMALLHAIDGDRRWRWLELGCSVAEGRGDALSDLDLGLGVAEDAWPEALDDLADLLGELSKCVGILRHHLPNVGDLTHERMFVQYAGGAQVDLVAVPAHLPGGTQPENIVLYDPDAIRSERRPVSVRRPDGATVREWAFLGWVALADLVKYLRRGSLWEALERLHEARSQVWRLWAVTHGLRYPVYGMTSVIDHPEIALPPGIEATVAALNGNDLLRAASACADLLREVTQSAARAVGGDPPTAMASFVQRRLEDVRLAR